MKPRPELELISHPLCPYVQRAAIALAEKGVPFVRTTVDLAHRPAWFRALSPLGKVPVLKVDGEAVFESAVILEYLEDTEARPLHPADPLARARHRSWIEFGSSVLNDIGALYNAADARAFDAKRALLHEKFARLEAELGDGPYFGGARFSLVDAVFGPIFRYWDVFDAIGAFASFDGLAKVQAWRRALAARPSVAAAVDAGYPARLHAFLRARGSHISALIAADEAIVAS